MSPWHLTITPDGFAVSVVSVVSAAIEQIKREFPEATVTVREDGEGGAYVTVEDVLLGAPYAQATTWVGFRVVSQYPYADVYPHYVRGDLARADGRPLAAELQRVNFEGRDGLQVSRRSNRLNPVTDTAVLKLHKVLAWLLARP